MRSGCLSFAIVTASFPFVAKATEYPEELSLSLRILKKEGNQPFLYF